MKLYSVWIVESHLNAVLRISDSLREVLAVFVNPVTLDEENSLNQLISYRMN